MLHTPIFTDTTRRALVSWGRLQTAAWLLLAGAARADEREWFFPLGQPPKATPRRISSGEGVPPLPLPATPIRRSEHKRQPSPAKLIAKVVWGESAPFTYENGESCTIADWNLCPADLQQLLQKTHRTLGLAYGADTVDLGTFDGDPAKIAVLFFSGTRSLKFSPRQLELLRAYTLNGGMLVFDSVAGSPYFYDAVKSALAAAFPDQALRVIPADHPFYHLACDVHRVRYPKNLDLDTPVMEGLYIGCRIGALVSKFGLGCGWDDHEVPFIAQAQYYDAASAERIGLNLVSYAIGYAAAGREEAKPELFGALDARAPTDEFVFAQIRHEGAWNVHPGAAAALLQRLRQNTALKTSLKRVPVTPGKDDLASFPFLYLSGLDDFRWDPTALAALRQFLGGAGTLFINNGLGLKTFDTAVRRELKQLLPEAKLEPLPTTHPLYRGFFTIEEVRYTPPLLAERPGRIDPYLEGITLNGDLRVIYSPYDLEAGWEGCEHPLARGLEPESAMQVGVNVLMYAATH